ncbi:DUF2381 family protein [Hyalangium versicolor]|uniref:DUF2381 family protein n=1 Tax=Hyalangium versicolor TaxID=2861190 RepID=UPI001CC95C67|nr:DUF2381 family protein [Hyalangium versicolor]
MRNLFFSGAVLLVALVSSVTLARERDPVAVRTLLLSEHPHDATHRIYVAGQVVTVLRFEQACDPARTKLLGWEGRFEPLACVGKHVVLEPLRDLDEDEGVPLLVTLADETEVPFLLRPPKRDEWAWTDQQVNVFKDRESYASIVSALGDARRKNAELREEVERLRQEKTSKDSALAAVLASGAIDQTQFKPADWVSGKDTDAEFHVTLFRGKGKAGAVFKIKNLDARQSWALKTARLVTLAGGQERVVAVSATSTSISPGGSGVVAFVVDKSAFMEEGALTNLLLEIYRHDGLRQGFVQLDHSLVEK